MKKFLFQFPAHLLMVFCGLFGAIFCLVTGFELLVDEKPLFWGCVLIAVCFTALFSVKKALWKGLLLLGAAGGLWFGAVCLWDEVRLGAEGVLNQLRGLYTSLYFGYTDAGGIHVTVAELREGETVFLLLVAALLGCYLAWGVVSLRTFWSGALVTAVFLVPSLIPIMLPDWLPLTALMVFYCVGLLTRMAGKSDAQGGAKLIYLAFPLALALLVVLRLALPEEDYRRSEWAEERRLALVSIGGRAGEVLGTGDIGALPQVLTRGKSTKVDLAAAGPLNFDGSTVLRVTSPYSGRMYLRGWSTGRYENNAWLPLEDEVYEEYLTIGLDGGGADWSYINGVNPISFPTLAYWAGSTNYRRPMEAVVEQQAGDWLLYVPYHLASDPEELAGVTANRDEYLERSAGRRVYTFSILPELYPAYAGELTGRVQLAELDYGALVHDAYTALPEGYDAQALLEDYQEWRQGRKWPAQEPWAYGYYEGSGEDGAFVDATWLQERNRANEARMAAARWVAAYLAHRCVYDPRTPATPEGEDFVTYFLNESRIGYCMHFASAATILLRAMEIPARYTAGYVADVEMGKQTPVADYAAHAWVEVYLEGYGWQPVEVTAGFDGELPWAQMEAEPTPVPTPLPSLTPPPIHTPRPSPTLPPTPAPTAPAAPVEGTPGKGTGDMGWLWLPGGIAALAVLELLRRRWVSWQRKRRLVDAPPNRAVIHGYQDLERILRWTGRPVPEELLALAQKAKFSQHILTPEERAAFLREVSALARDTAGRLPWYKKPAFAFVHGGWL